MYQAYPQNARKPLAAYRLDDFVDSTCADQTYETEIIRGTDEAEERMLRGLHSGTLMDPFSRPRHVIGSVEADGSGCAPNSHSVYEEEFHHLPGPLLLLPSTETAPDALAYDRRVQETSASMPDTYTPEKWRKFNTPVTDTINRRSEITAGTRAAHIDGLLSRRLNLDKFELAVSLGEQVAYQQAISGKHGELARDMAPTYDTNSAEEWAGQRIIGERGQFDKTRAAVYPDLAAYLLTSQTDTMATLRRGGEFASAHMLEDLERIVAGSSEDFIDDDGFRTLEFLITRTLTEMENNKTYDPMMLQFVTPGDPRYVEGDKIRATRDKIQKIVIGRTPERVGSDEKLLFALALHMRDSQIPLTVENVIGELDTLLQIRNTVQRVAGSIAAQLENGGPMEYIDAVTEEDIILFNSTSKKIMMHLCPKLNDVISIIPVYPETYVAAHNLYRTMFIPSSEPWRKDEKDQTAGGYIQGTARNLKDMRDIPDITERGEESQKLTYDPRYKRGTRNTSTFIDKYSEVYN